MKKKDVVIGMLGVLTYPDIAPETGTVLSGPAEVIHWSPMFKRWTLKFENDVRRACRAHDFEPYIEPQAEGGVSAIGPCEEELKIVVPFYADCLRMMDAKFCPWCGRQLRSSQ